MPENSAQWTIFAWQGFRMEVPLDWDLGSFDGDDASGYLRLDDLMIPRMAIRWKRFGRASHIDQAVKRYLESVERGNKDREQYSEPRPLNVNVAWAQDLQVRCYRWRGQKECAAAVIQCAGCKRISVVEIFFPRGKFRADVCRRVFGSLHDHNRDDVAYWDCYLLHLRTPVSWKLLSHKFNPGYAELNFAGPGKLQVDFRRWGPASVLLEEKDLEQWARENWPARLKADSVHTVNRDGELSQVARRNASGLLAPLQRLLGRGPAIRRALYWHSTAWHCSASERLWMVDVFAGSGLEAAEVEWQVLCHQPAKI